MKKLLIKILEFYQSAISPHLKTQCKFYPSCSQYAILAIKKYGSFIGITKSAYRILRCNPFNSGGIDWP